MSEPDIGTLLAAIERKEPGAWEQLMALVYDDLRRIAHGQMRRIAPDQTLSTTILVHETFEKLAASRGLRTDQHSEFYALCASAMRQIIIDHYRKRSAEKRSCKDLQQAADLEVRRVNPEADSALDLLGSVLTELLARDPQLVEVFEMRYFAGMSEAEIASRLGLSLRSVQRLAARARAWIVMTVENAG